MPLQTCIPRMICKGVLKIIHKKGINGMMIPPIRSSFTFPNLSENRPSNGKKNNPINVEAKFMKINKE